MGFWDSVKKTLVGSAPEKPAASASASASSSAPAKPAPDVKPGEGFKAAVVEAGTKGWGGPLTIAPNSTRRLIYSVTGGGIHPVAQRLADLTGAEPFDGFKSKADFGEIAAAVIDCGGTARVGVYPMKGIPTIDIHAATPSGPLMKYITEENFVSGVKPENIKPVE
jgi:PTS system glucitol/sorbitol-specific IIB component